MWEDYPLDLHSSVALVNLHLSRGNVCVLYVLFYLANYMVQVASDNVQFNSYPTWQVSLLPLFLLTSLNMTRRKKKTSLQKETQVNYLNQDADTFTFISILVSSRFSVQKVQKGEIPENIDLKSDG